MKHDQLYVLTRHAWTVTRERCIEPDWIRRTITSPELCERDPYDPALEHRLKTIIEYGHRVLRVVITAKTKPFRVVTAYFDRRMKGRL